MIGDEITDTIGGRIKYLRTQNELTQEELVNELIKQYNYPINVATLSLCENDKRMPSVDFIVCLAKYFECSTDYLLCMKEIDYTDNIDLDSLRYMLIKKFINSVEDLNINEIIDLSDVLNK